MHRRLDGFSSDRLPRFLTQVGCDVNISVSAARPRRSPHQGVVIGWRRFMPDDPKAVMRLIVETTRKMDSDEELSVTFLQIGKDAGATRFLKALDDELPRAGAKFDICDTITCDDMEELSLTEILVNALQD